MPCHLPQRLNLALTASLLLHFFILFGIAVQIPSGAQATVGVLHAMLSVPKPPETPRGNRLPPQAAIEESKPVEQKLPAVPKKQQKEAQIASDHKKQKPLPPDKKLVQKLVNHVPDKQQPDMPLQTATVPAESITPPVAPTEATGTVDVARTSADSAAHEDQAALSGQGTSSAHGTDPAGVFAVIAGWGNSTESQPGLDRQEIEQYRWSLGKAIGRFKLYPKLARERGWEGNARFSIDFATRLPMPDIVLTHSSGHELLDTQAHEMIRQAINTTLLPENLRGHNFNLSFTVEFKLEGLS